MASRTGPPALGRLLPIEAAPSATHRSTRPTAALNQQLAQLFDESQVYRMNHGSVLIGPLDTGP